MEGGWLSNTSTAHCACVELPRPSLAVLVITLEPRQLWGKWPVTYTMELLVNSVSGMMNPLSSIADTLTGTVLVQQLSVAVGFGNVNVAEQIPGSVASVIGAAPQASITGLLLKSGGRTSSIVTTKAQELVLPEGSLAVHVTV